MKWAELGPARPSGRPATPTAAKPSVPSVTVVAVAHNDQGRIEPFVASLCRQTFGAFEIVIVDHASTDYSFDEALACAQIDDRIRVLSASAELTAGDIWQGAIKHVRTAACATLPIADLVDERALEQIVEQGPADVGNGAPPLGRLLHRAVTTPREAATGLVSAPAHKSPLSLDALGDFRGVVLSPAVRYHADELVPLGDELAALGIDSLLLLPSGSPDALRVELTRLGRDFVEWPERLDDLPPFSAMVTLNDWGRRELLALAARRGVPSFAKVEGVQDFDDVDTGRRRHPYRRADYVLYQGRNDVRALAGTRGAVVGNTRLEQIARLPEREFGDTSTIVINSNFTYQVLTGERESWLDSVLEACARIGVTPLISQHHADGSLDEGLPIAHQPMRHLLTTADVLVSRFSTVPFEAMARGVPFVYHNPHGERVPAFAEPHGAFLQSTDTGQLADALKLSLDWRGSYRERCWPFFEQQVDVADEPSERRAATYIADVIERWRTV